MRQTMCLKTNFTDRSMMAELAMAVCVVVRRSPTESIRAEMNAFLKVMEKFEPKDSLQETEVKIIDAGRIVRFTAGFLSAMIQLKKERRQKVTERTLYDLKSFMNLFVEQAREQGLENRLLASQYGPVDSNVIYLH